MFAFTPTTAIDNSSNKENVTMMDKPKFRKLLSKSDLSAAPPPSAAPVFLKQRSVLAPKPMDPNNIAPSIHAQHKQHQQQPVRFQLKSDTPAIRVAPSIHNPQIVLQKPKPQPQSNFASSFDLRGGSSTGHQQQQQPAKPLVTLPAATVPLPVFTNKAIAIKRDSNETAKKPAVITPPIIVAAPAPAPAVVEKEEDKMDVEDEPGMAATAVVPVKKEDAAAAALLRRKQLREEEQQRRGRDIINRARTFEAEGKTAAAISLYKESMLYFPGNSDKLERRVEQLQAKLLQEHTSNFGGDAVMDAKSQEEDDFLEAMFATQQQQAPAPSRVRSSSTASLSAMEVDMDPAATAAGNQTPNELLAQKLARLVKAQPALSSVSRFIETYLDVERIHLQAESVNFSKVRFHALDCAITPPSTRVETDEEMYTQLYPVEEVMDRLAQCNKFAHEILRNKTALAHLPQVYSALEAHPYGRFLTCTLAISVSASQQCQCDGGSKHRCREHAIPVRDRLAQILSTAMRCVLRRIFNNSSLALVANTGSYRFANDDVAAVVHRALLLFETRQSRVDNIVLLSGGSRMGNDEDIACVGEFVQAHQFLLELFPTNEACSAISDANQSAWAKLRKYLSVAREFKLADELVFAPLANLHDFVNKLQQQTPLVRACHAHVDLAYRRAMKEDKCGQCNCEGAKRRRANAMGMWMAPSLLHQGANSRHAAAASEMREQCSLCSQAVLAGGGISCECCEKQFHTACLNLPRGYDSDFVCGKCVPKFLHHH